MVPFRMTIYDLGHRVYAWRPGTCVHNHSYRDVFSEYWLEDQENELLGATILIKLAIDNLILHPTRIITTESIV